MPLRSFQDIGSYWLFIEGALPGTPLPLGAEALRMAAEYVFEELGLNVVPRNWLQLVAQLESRREAYRNLAGSIREANLRQAIACYETALVILYLARMDYYAHIVSSNLERARIDLQQLGEG